jgi:predicted DNA-binding transcriptional regulator AlpA
MSERLLNARELGELLGLAPGTVLDRYEAGDLPGFNLYGKRGGPVRFRWSEIEAALESWRPSDAAAPGRGKCEQAPADAAATPLSVNLPLANKPEPPNGGHTDEEEP